VGHEEIRQPNSLELLEQVDDLGLDDTSGTRPVVADDEARLHGERAGDADPLALAAGSSWGSGGPWRAASPA